jgi:hypothetical protein
VFFQTFGEALFVLVLSQFELVIENKLIPRGDTFWDKSFRKVLQPINLGCLKFVSSTMKGASSRDFGKPKDEVERN